MADYIKQNINIGLQSNDGTGDSIREAFRKTNENFQILFNYIGAGDGLTFFGSLQDTPNAGEGTKLIVTDSSGTTLTQVSLIGGQGVAVDYQYENGRWVINNTTSTLATDPNPTLSTDLNGANFRATTFANPVADQDLVTRKFLYDNFLNRDGTYRTGSATSTATTLGGSTLRENIKLVPTANTGTLAGKTITVYDSTGSLKAVNLDRQATDPAHVTRKDYVDTKISLQGVDTIDPATGEVNPGAGKMTGPLILSRDPKTTDDVDYSGMIAATKRYVDFNDFYSENNLFVTQKGRDYQPEVPPIRRGRAQAYAFATINKAAQYAEKLISTSRIIVGDYARLITYDNGTPATVVDIVDDYFGNNLARLRLNVGNLGSDQFGAAEVGNFTIFPGQYVEGVDSKAIGMIENIAKGENLGDPEIYSIAYVDYGDDFDTDIVTSIPDFSNTNIVRFTFSNEPQQIVPIPDFWIGYQFYTDGGGQGTIVNIDADVDNRGVYHNYFDVEFESGAPAADITYGATEWHVYSGDFIPGETIVYNTNVSSLQITLVVESGEYYEQYPIKLAANVSIRGDEFRRCIIRPAAGPSASKWANTYFRRDAQVDGLQTSALDYSTDYADDDNLSGSNAIPSGSSGVISIAIRGGTFSTDYIGYMFVGNGGQGIIETGSETGFTVNLGTPMLNAAEISAGDWHIYRPITFGYHYLRDTQRPMNLLTTVNNPGGLEGAATLLTKNRSFFQDEVIAYIDQTFVSTGTFTYDTVKCHRDVGLIVDSIAHDLVYGGSERTIFAGESYRDVTVVKETEAVETAAAVTYLNLIAQQVILNESVTTLSTATQVFDSSINVSAVEPTAGDVIADLSQALARIIIDDPAYNPPKNNDQLDVFLMNDANVIRYVSVQGHGGFMQVLDPAGQIKNKSPYTQTASSFSQSIAKHRFAGGMLVDGFSGNVMCSPVDWDPINSPLALNVTGLIRRPQVPTFFMNNGVRYEVDFIANFRQDGVDSNNVPLYAATLRLNPLTPGGIPSTFSLIDNAGGFAPNQTNIPIIVEQPTGIGGLAARGHATSDSSGYITEVIIDFPGTGYKATPFVSVGGAVLNNLTIVAGGVTGASIVTGGYGYAVGCKIEIIPTGIIGGVKAVGSVVAVDDNGTITEIQITTPGANWTSSVNYRVSFGNLNMTVPEPTAGFIDQQPEDVELITAGNRSMLANDFTQVNDLGYGIFVTNGGFMENVSMFTYYCYRSYFSLNGSQVRTLTGSSCYGEYGLVADGADPTEVPISLSNVFPMVQVAEAYVNNPLFPAQAGQTYIFVKIDTVAGGYPPLNGSLIEINHSGIRKQYSVGSASPALNSQNEPIFGVYQLFFNTGNIAEGSSQAGLLTEVKSGDPIIIRANTLVKVSGFNPVSIARPSTSLTWNDNPTYVYHITGFSEVQPDGSVFAYTQEDYNYVVFQAVDQGIIHPTLLNNGSGYGSTGTTVSIITGSLISSVSHYVDGTQGLGTIGIQTITLDDVTNIKVGHIVNTGTYILPNTYVTWISTNTNQICVNNPTAGPITSGTMLTFTGVQPQAHVTVSSGTISSIVIDNGGVGWNVTATNIGIIGEGFGAAVANPVPIAGVAGSFYVKITTLDLTSQNRILAGINSNPPKYYQFAHSDEIYDIVGYSTPSSRGVIFEVAITDGAYTSVAVSEPGSGYADNQQLVILGTQLGGSSPENDLILNVIQRNSSGGVLAVSFTGTSIAGTINFPDVSPPEAGQISAEIVLNKPLKESVSPGTILRAGIPINSAGQLTTKISILRATGHDFVDIGTGGYATTRIPNDLYGPPIKQRNPSNEVIQANRGRVYYVTSDQDGNFRVGDALTVNQAQGSVTISVPLDLSNLSAISLRRDLGPPVNEFSIDSTMITEADYKLPTEQAVANYINRRLGLDRNGNIYPGSPLGPQFLALDGQLAMKADLNMGYTNRVINMETPAENNDAANKGYVDTKISNAGTAAINVNGVTLEPQWGNMTGSLQLYNDPDVKSAVLAMTATVFSTTLKFETLTVPGLHQPGDFYQHRIIVPGVPTGTIVNSVFQDSVSIALGNPDTDENVQITQTIPKGTVVYFDPIKQAATKRYVDKLNQFSKLNDVELTNLEDTDIPMFAEVMPISTSSTTPLYESTRKLINVANNVNTILNTPTGRAGGSDITVARSNNTVTYKLRGGAGSNNPITDYHVNDDAQIAQSKLFLTTATVSATWPTGTQRQIQAYLGSAQFDSQMFVGTNGWMTLRDATTTTNGVLTNKHAWVPKGGGLLGSVNTQAANSTTYITSATVKAWLQDESTNWSFSSDLRSNGDLTHNVGAPGTRWSTLYANSATFSTGIVTTGSYTGLYERGTVIDYTSGMGRITVANTDGVTIYNGGTAARAALLSVDGSGNVLQTGGTLGTQAATMNVFNTTATTVNAFGAGTTVRIGNASGTLTLNNPTVVGNAANTTVNLWNTVATTVNAFGAATGLNLGANNGTTTLRSSTLVGTAATQNVFNTVATTVNAFGAATQLNLGNATGLTTVAGNLAALNITDNGNRVITSVDWSAGSGISITSEVTSGPAASATINNTGVLSLAVSGTGLSINASTGALTVTSNATSANTGGTIVARDGSGNFSAGTITASAFSGGTFSGSSASLTGSLTVSSGNATGGGIILADDGDIVDMNTGYCAMRFSSGVQIYNANKGGSAVITLSTNGVMYGTASSALYADLAENYQADATYNPGTVLMFGGDNEVTLATVDGTSKVAGVVSTNPAYLMNDSLKGDTVVSIALQGRVPCKVKGKVRKGDMMVATADGYARSEENPKVGSVIGKALENFDGEEGVIEVVVGRV